MATSILNYLPPQRLYSTWLPLVWAVFLIHSTLPVGLAKVTSPKTDLDEHNEAVCESIDIRNSIKMFDQLTGCRVVEGYVQILLFDTMDSSQFANLSFPDLVEITDYLLLYRVSGLLSLGQLFPNLVVIRGYQLLFGYAFIIFEMPSLQEINLYSLTDIVRGSIRIDKNPLLCFVDSIDWNLIAHVKTGHFIKNIKSENECPLCPGDDKNSADNGKVCPLASFSHKDVTKNRHLCWNRERCQKVCSRNCRACDEIGNCCDDKCLGGCSVHDRSNCTVCKNFTMEMKDGRTCLSSCPRGLYEYLGRKCVRQEDCIGYRNNRSQQEHPYRIFNNTCVLECPKDYMDVRRTCMPCEGRCMKVCPGKTIDSLSAIQELSGCTHINGSLEIQIRGGQNVVHELEENLKLVTVIDGYVKILRSFPLVSLSFFKALTVIKGNVLDKGRYVISVLDNQNLQDIWDWTNRTLTVGNGSLFFHFNPKLCMQKIQMLQKQAKLPQYKEHEVSEASNGDKVACDVKSFSVNISVTRSHEVKLEWPKFEIVDPRKLLAFLIFYIEAPSQNISLHDNRDACGDDGWSRVDVQIPDTYQNKEIPMTKLLTGLKPYTQYAFYIQTYTIATQHDGAQSGLQYFRTDADQPSYPTNIQVTSNSSDSIRITWGPPKHPNGNITYYKVIIIRQDKSKTANLLQQNYCDRYSHPTIKPQVTETPTPSKPNDTCDCKGKTKNKFSVKENEISSQISFEDELINKVYIRKPNANTRKKRETLSDDRDLESTLTNLTISDNSSLSDKHDYHNHNEFIIKDSYDFFVNNLHHYTDYTVIVQACREKIPGNTLPECSEKPRYNQKTKEKDDADIITSGISIYHKNLTSISLKWDPPVAPNGNIQYYLIEYKRLDIENPYTQCINHADFQENHHIYTLYGLNPGNYSVKVLAVSEAKTDRKYSSPIYFLIEESSNYDILYIFGSLFSLIVIFLFIFFIYKRHVQKPSDNKLIATVNPEYISTAYEPDEWEVPRKKIELHKELGQGSFGMVYEGIARDVKGKAQVRCAIKTVNEHATNRERIEFLNEASVMKAFDTAHVVKLLGVVSQGQPTLVIMELMANGDLKSYLRSHRPELDNSTSSIMRQPPTLKRILQMAIEIADGMAYLAAKKFVHRDLAARNCMVSEDLTVKIGDFGMTRDIYETDYYRKGTKGLLPVRWMAPESLKDGIFSSSSDIWSYGVVLWEMATLASQPYQGLSNDQVLRYVIDGGIMERPENCPDKLYMLMMYCWKHKYSERPTFLELCSLLIEDASPTFSKISFYHSAAGIEARSSRNNQVFSQDDATTPLRLTSDLDENFSLNSSGPDSEPEDDLLVNTHLEFASYPVHKDNSATVNGYLGANASNGTTA